MILAAAALFAVQCTAKAIYIEARGEPMMAQKLVASVVINRAKEIKGKPKLRDTCSVVKTKGTFPWYKKHPIWVPIEELGAWQQALAIAAAAQYVPHKYASPYMYFNELRLGKRFNTQVKPVVSGHLIFY